MKSPKFSQIAFVVKNKLINLIWRSWSAQLYHFAENITEAKSTDFKSCVHYFFFFFNFYFFSKW